MKAWLITLIAVALGGLLKVVSPVVRDELEQALNRLELKAKETPNPFDDMFVATLKEVLGFE